MPSLKPWRSAQRNAAARSMRAWRSVSAVAVMNRLPSMIRPRIVPYRRRSSSRHARRSFVVDLPLGEKRPKGKGKAHIVHGVGERAVPPAALHDDVAHVSAVLDQIAVERGILPLLPRDDEIAVL